MNHKIRNSKILNSQLRFVDFKYSIQSSMRCQKLVKLRIKISRFFAEITREFLVKLYFFGTQDYRFFTKIPDSV